MLYQVVQPFVRLNSAGNPAVFDSSGNELTSFRLNGSPSKCVMTGPDQTDQLTIWPSAGSLTFNQAQPISCFPSFDHYNNQVLAGDGLASILARGAVTAKTAIQTITSIATVAVRSWMIAGSLDVTAFTSGTVNLNLAWTDINSNARNFNMATLTAIGITQPSVIVIRAAVSTMITVATTGNIVGTYDASAVIFQID